MDSPLAHELIQSRPAAHPFDGESERPKVLVVDDEYGPRESIAFTLGTAFMVDKAERAQEALQKIERVQYSVIVLDIRMPEMDGVTALRKIREMDPEVAVIMLTGYGTLHTAQQAIIGGANQYMRKPPDIGELLDAVRKQAEGTALRRREAENVRRVTEMNLALKREIEASEPKVWQANAAAELVHDLANPLTVMIGYVGLMGDEAKRLVEIDPARAERLQNYASVVERAAEYCHHLAENWRQATRKSDSFVELQVRPLMEEVRDVIFFSNTAIRLEGDDDVWVRGSRFELARVVQNLLRNALEAGAKNLVVTTTGHADRVEISFADDGAGMSAETAKSALKGGFTTKSHGTGLGLSICRHIVGAHGGSLALESVVGKGTTVRLTFPAK